MKNVVFQSRKVLLSTGELGQEVYTHVQGEALYECSPAGTTLGNNEAPIFSLSESDLIACIEGLDKNDKDQNRFDKSISIENFGSSISVPLSLVYLRVLAKMAGLSIPSYLQETYGTLPAMPIPICNILNGGPHAGNSLEMCEYMIIPRGNNIEENILIASEVYLDLQEIITNDLGVSHTMVGKEGGFAPNIDNIFDALNLIQRAIDSRNNGRCSIAIDVAANSFSEENSMGYIYKVKGITYNTQEFLQFYVLLIKTFPSITYLEDPFNENDKDGWRGIMKKFSSTLMIVADDLTVSNEKHINENLGLFNAIILKVNQIGTFSGLLAAYRLSQLNGITTIISQRSCETDSNILALLAYGFGSQYMKAGAPARERIVKYNELIRISSLNAKLTTA